MYNQISLSKSTAKLLPHQLIYFRRTKNNQVRLTSLNLVMLLVLLVFSIQVTAQTNLIELRVTNQLELLEPGNSYTIVFEISNKSLQEYTLESQLIVPNEFNVFQAKKNMILKPNSKKNVMFTFGVSRQCEANSYPIILKIAQNDVLIIEKKIILDVAKLYSVSIDVLKFPDYLRLEKNYNCEYIVTNNGNSTEKIAFESTNSFKIAPLFATIKPDSSVVVKVYQNVPRLSHKSIALNTLRARILSKDTLFSNQTTIDIFPNTNEKPDLYHRFPIAISSTYNSLKGADTINAIKYQLEGNGYVDLKNKHYVGFNYSGPSKKAFERFGEYEQYNILYRTNNFETNLGDVNFSFSNITETSRYGKGGILFYKLGKIATSLFYIEPRFTNQIKESYGGKLNYSVTDRTNLQFGLIKRLLNENQDEFNSTIYSASANYLGNKFKLNSEIALENNYKTYGFGYSLESSLALKKLQIESSWQHTDKKYLGYLRNSNQLNASIQYKILKMISVSIQAFQSSINPVKDTINYSSSPIINRYQANLNFYINKRNNLKIGGFINSSEDRFLPKKFDYEEKLVSLTYSNYLPNAHHFNWYTRYGTSVNNLSAGLKSKNVWYSSAQYSRYFTNYFEAGLTGDYQQTNKASAENELIASFYYGGFVRLNYKNIIDLNVFYKSDYDADELADPKSYLEGRLTFNYRPYHQFSIAASQASLPINPNRKELMISATYKLNLNVPLSKDKTVGSLHGIVSSNEAINLAGILFQLDDQVAITNHKGEFNFYQLIPKTYTLSIKQSSLPSGKSIIEKLPQQIEVIPNREMPLKFTLGNTGSLAGRINVEQLDDLQSIQFIKKLPKIVVKISNEHQEFLTKTNDSGNFEFKELVPGDWTVELFVNHLQNDFTFEVTRKIVTIESNKNNNIIFKASTKKREVIKSKKRFEL